MRFKYNGHRILDKKGNENMEKNFLKKSDFITSVIIILIIAVVFVGVVVYRKNNADDTIDNTPEVYTAEEFTDAIANGSGTYLVEGNMVVENIVVSDNIDGEYIYFIKETLTKVKSYKSLSWEAIDTDIQTCDSIIFLDTEIPISTFVSLASSNYVETIKLTDNTQYRYYGIEAISYGTLSITIETGRIVSVDEIYPDMAIVDVKDWLKNGDGITIYDVLTYTILIVLATIIIFAILSWDNLFSKKEKESNKMAMF